MTGRRLLIALLAVCLAGCISLEPTYRRPPAPVPASFPAGPPYPPPTVEAVSPIGWRTFFVDANLRAVIELALKNNRDLRAALANVEIARGQYGAQRAQLYPELEAEVSGVYSQSPIIGFTPQTGAAGSGGSGTLNEHQLTAGLTVPTYVLDLFGQMRNLSKAAFETYLASAQTQRAAQITVVGQVATAYFTLGADRAMLAIAANTLASGEASLNLTQARFKNGVASELDVSQARTTVEQARFDIARLTVQCAQDKNALDLLVGSPTPEALLPSGLEGPSQVAVDLPVGVSSAVLLSRPDVAAAEETLRSANANIGAARAAFFPSITLTGAGGATSASLAGLFSGPQETWTFTPQLLAPIFDAGRNRANLAQARGTFELDRAQYEKAIQVAFRETADALAQRGRIEAEVAAQRALVAAAAESLKLADARYQRGADTYLNVLIAQRTLYAAQQTLTTTLLLRITNLIALYQALGGGLS